MVWKCMVQVPMGQGDHTNAAEEASRCQRDFAPSIVGFGIIISIGLRI